MRRGKFSLDEHLTLINNKVNLPTRNIYDGILLTVKATYTNSNTTTDAELTDEQLARAIQDIRVVSDNTHVHYALNLEDVLTMNYNDTAGKVPSLDSTNTIPADDSITKEFLVRLDGGNILAGAKQSLFITYTPNTQVSTDVSLTNLDITITTDELVIEDVAEIQAMYGDNLQYLAEPKITALEQNVSANTSFTGLIEIPTGNAILRNIYIAKDSTGARSNSLINEYGIVDRNSSVFFKQHFNTGQHDDIQQYNLPAALKGVTILDIAEEMAGNNMIFSSEVGMKGWNFVKGDFFDAFKLNESGKIRVIRHELICAQGLKDVLDGYTSEDEIPEGFTYGL
jgi:hypothetical protein